MRKPKEVKVYSDHMTDLKIPVFMATDYTFFAEYNGQRWEAAGVAELEEKLSADLRKMMSAEWVAVIEIKHIYPNVHYQSIPQSFVGFKPSRYWIGKRTDGAMIRADWDTTEEQRNKSHRTAGSPISQNWWPPVFPINREETIGNYMHGQEKVPSATFIAYEETLWNALSQLAENIKAVRKKLTSLLTTQEGLTALPQMVGLKLLETPKEDQ